MSVGKTLFLLISCTLSLTAAASATTSSNLRSVEDDEDRDMFLLRTQCARQLDACQAGPGANPLPIAQWTKFLGRLDQENESIQALQSIVTKAGQANLASLASRTASVAAAAPATDEGTGGVAGLRGLVTTTLQLSANLSRETPIEANEKVSTILNTLQTNYASALQETGLDKAAETAGDMNAFTFQLWSDICHGNSVCELVVLVPAAFAVLALELVLFMLSLVWVLIASIFAHDDKARMCTTALTQCRFNEMMAKNVPAMLSSAMTAAGAAPIAAAEP